MKTIRKIIKEVVDHELEIRGLLAGDLSKALSDKIYSAIQERKDRKGDACPLEWMSVLYAKTGIDPYTASVGMRQQLSECGKALIGAGADMTDLDRFMEWWKSYTAKWSIDASYPTPKQIRDNWGKFTGSMSHAGPLVVR